MCIHKQPLCSPACKLLLLCYHAVQQVISHLSCPAAYLLLSPHIQVVESADRVVANHVRCERLSRRITNMLPLLQLLAKRVHMWVGHGRHAVGCRVQAY